MNTCSREDERHRIEAMESENRGLDLERELQCSICTEVLYQPLTLLDCLHTFCGACLKEWFSFQLDQARNSPNSVATGTTPYSCPSCRAPVRDTKHNATVTTLLDMFMAANPEKQRTPQEKEDIKGKYTIGENVLPKVDVKEMTLRERRVEDEDRRLLEEVRTMSLREAGVESTEARRERRRREEGRSHSSRSQSSRDNSRDHRSAEDRERRRRREAEVERRSVRDGTNLRPETVPTEERRRRRSDEEATRRRNEITSRTAARQIEHQSSLRSLISPSDTDSHEMEEEILRQIREEGLLDGIDLENIDVNQEDQISERIAEAFRRRQDENERLESARRRDAGRRESSGRRRASNPAPESRENSGDDSTRARSATQRHRTHSRSTSAVNQGEGRSRPPPSMSAAQAAHLDVQSGDETGRRRRRTMSNGRSATTPVPVAEPETRPTARAQTDLSRRPQSYHTAQTRPLITATSRSSTDPVTQHISELPGSRVNSQPNSQHTPSPHASPRIPAELGEHTRATGSTGVSRTRAAPPADIIVQASTPSAEISEDRSLMPAPLSPRVHDVHDISRFSLSDRATAVGSASRPTSSYSPTGRIHLELFPEPDLTCAQCQKTHIEYELHYNCGICRDGKYDICLSCYRQGKGCLHWFGFGEAAWRIWRWNKESGKLPATADKPHMLHASRYIAPKIPEGGADGRRTLTPDDPRKRLQSGAFCSNCLSWANECYWRCNQCNEGDWGFCNTCVNQGKSCTHALLPMTYQPPESTEPALSPIQDHQMPPSARILAGPGIGSIGNFKFLTFSTSCDICRYPIQPSTTRYHCYSCISQEVNNLGPGDYDICTPCYSKLVSSRRISAENGHNGWRRCLQGHRMIVCGFKDDRKGQCRVVVHDLVGGHDLAQDSIPIKDYTGGELEVWSWGNGAHVKYDGIHKKLVTKDVMKTVPTTLIPDMVNEKGFPPDGGVGMKALAEWSWYPQDGVEDELLFPKGAELRDCKDVNEDWFHGTYMGKSGLFPAPYAKILNRNVGF